MHREEILDIPHVDGSDGVVAVIVRGVGDVDRDGVTALTTRDDSIQVLVNKYHTGHVIPAHWHRPKLRLACPTQEVLLILSGRVLLDVFNSDQVHLGSRYLGPGDMAILKKGGHRLQMLGEVRILETKSGPYLGRDADKEEFAPVQVPASASEWLDDDRR